MISKEEIKKYIAENRGWILLGTGVSMKLQSFILLYYSCGYIGADIMNRNTMDTAMRLVQFMDGGTIPGYLLKFSDMIGAFSIIPAVFGLYFYFIDMRKES